MPCKHKARAGIAATDKYTVCRLQFARLLVACVNLFTAMYAGRQPRNNTLRDASIVDFATLVPVRAARTLAHLI